MSKSPVIEKNILHRTMRQKARDGAGRQFLTSRQEKMNEIVFYARLAEGDAAVEMVRRGGGGIWR